MPQVYNQLNAIVYIKWLVLCTPTPCTLPWYGCGACGFMQLNYGIWQLHPRVIITAMIPSPQHTYNILIRAGADSGFLTARWYLSASHIESDDDFISLIYNGKLKFGKIFSD